MGKFDPVRKRKKLPILEKLLVSDLAAEGKSIARVENQVIFITRAVPGDIVDVQVTRKQKNFLEGYPIHFHHLSEMRAEPFCEHFGTCGGCKWQNLPYEKQLGFKQKQVADAFERIGKMEIPPLRPILASRNTRFYRNKLEFTFTNRRWLSKEEMAEDTKEMNGVGLHIPGRFDKVLDLTECHLQKAPSNDIRLFIRQFALKKGLEFFDLRKQEGFLRTLIIRTSETGDLMVILVFFRENKQDRVELLTALKDSFPQITSLFWVVNQKANDTVTDQEFHLFHGKDHMLEKMGELVFKVGPKSFYQTNSLQAHELYKVVLDFAAPTTDDIIYDLYTGTGTIACFLAKRAARVAGLEFIDEAISDARVNAELNGIDNAEFKAGDIRHLLTEELLISYGKPDILVTDPPRSGMHKEVVERICEIQPRKVVYVSCNPATQARDIQMMDPWYRVTAIQPVDMFPQTHHVENVVLLEKR